jgi:hypothetical protein
LRQLRINPLQEKLSSTISTLPLRLNVRAIGTRGDASSCFSHWVSPGSANVIRVPNPA